jgi:hypothetical protein
MKDLARIGWGGRIGAAACWTIVSGETLTGAAATTYSTISWTVGGCMSRRRWIPRSERRPCPCTGHMMRLESQVGGRIAVKV